jgi:enoyl-CoA hydratase/carnithine racemase
MRVAVRGARLGHPEVRIGAVADFGGTTRLPRLIGKGRAADLLLTGQAIDAEHAERLGLVNHVVDPDALRSTVDTLAHEILAQAPLAVNLTWEAVHRGLAMLSRRLGAHRRSHPLSASAAGSAITTSSGSRHRTARSRCMPVSRSMFWLSRKKFVGS